LRCSRAVSYIELLFCMGDTVGRYCYVAGIEATRTLLKVITVTEQYHKKSLTVIDDDNVFLFVFFMFYVLLKTFLVFYC